MKKIVAASFAELFDEVGRRMREEEARLAAMSEAERAAYATEQAKKALRVEAILKQLRGPGFVEMKEKKP